MKNCLAILAILSFLAAQSGAAPIEFDFKDPKGVNNAVFKTDAPLESINGTATGISGKIAFDPENPGAIQGKILVAVESMHVANPRMKEHLHGRDWMDAAQFPQITFEVVSMKNAKTQSNVTTADAMGKMTIKGVTKEITVPVKLTYLKGRLKERQGRDGDLLVLRANFEIKRSDYGINAAKFEDKVSDTIELSLSIAGSAPR
jgi:polyisoprenoid-binding protein YceI